MDTKLTEEHFSDSVSLISSVKNSPSKCDQNISCYLFNWCDSAKPEKINILLLSSCCLWTLHDHKTLLIGIETSLLNLFFKIRGVWVFMTPSWISLRKNSAMNHKNHKTRSQSFTSSYARSTFAFVCSVLEFSLQSAGGLFAACNSFVCSVLEFSLQCVGVLFAACNSFACSVHVFF